MQGPSPLGNELRDPPADGITSVIFSSTSDHLLVSSWDATLRLYNARANQSKGVFRHRGPVLDCCFLDDSTVLSAGCDRGVRSFDVATGREFVLGSHDQAVKCIIYSTTTGSVITGSWDRTLRTWDPRASQGATAVFPVQERVYSMSAVDNTVVVALASRFVNVYDVRNMAAPWQRRESSLKYQTRCVRLYQNGTGYALSSVEGRVAMEFFDMSEREQSKKYAFKCHRKSEGNRDVVYPVNTISFHPSYGTFATGGGDGFVNVWDGNNKKRLYQYPKYPTSIAGLSFSKDGDLLAIASSYTFEDGEKQHPNDGVFIRAVTDGEVKPKPKPYVAP